MLSSFTYLVPRTRSELHEMLADHGASARLLAGGTDLLVNIRNGVMSPDFVVNVKKVEELQGITWDEKEGLTIRPAVTINEILRSEEVRERFPLLAVCAHDLASYQVRNRATVIGNVVNASPCSDMAPALLCLDAKAVISSQAGKREVSFREFFVGVKKTVLKPDEMLEQIVVPAAMQRARGSYHKLKRINGHDLGIVGVALMKHEGVVRLGISSAAPTPVFVGDLKEADSLETVTGAAMKAISPISDVRCSKEYREYMTQVFIKRLYEEVK